MENEAIKILVVDDEKDLCEILKFNLAAEGYIVDTANSGEEALTMEISKYNLLMLDVMMEEISGFALAKKLKDDIETKDIPIIFLTARTTENDIITGLKLGADDYISKPFSIREVILRIKVVLRRSYDEKQPEHTTVLSFKGLELNLDNKTVSIDGEIIPFTKKEFELLHLLLLEQGKVFSRNQLIKLIWSYDVEVTSRTVDVNITRIRKKIGAYGKYIITRPGFGYYFTK